MYETSIVVSTSSVTERHLTETKIFGYSSGSGSAGCDDYDDDDDSNRGLL